MQNRLKLLSLNIEGNNHYEQCIPFIRHQDADVITLQEVFFEDIELLSKKFQMHNVYAPLSVIKTSQRANLPAKGLLGVAIFTKKEFQKVRKDYYVGNEQNIPVFIDKEPYITNRAVLSVDIIHNDTQFRIATTHFTWSHGGETSDLQLKDLNDMQTVLKDLGNFVLSGDFNAPRGKEIYTKLSKQYKDNIPEDVKTTLDPDIHRVKNLQYVVDGLFSTKDYIVENVEVIGGVSDHKAVIANLNVVAS